MEQYLHIVTHAASKGLFFLTAGGVMHQTEERDIRKMGGLASKMPFSTVSGTIAALSIAGAPPLACFISEFLIFVGAIQIINVTGGVSSFYIIPTALMLVATVFSLAYCLRFISKVFLGTTKDEDGVEEGHKDVAEHMKHETTQNRRCTQLHEGLIGNLGGSGCSHRNLPDVLHESNTNSYLWRRNLNGVKSST